MTKSRQGPRLALDWSRLLGFDQIVNDRQLGTSGSGRRPQFTKVGGKVGEKRGRDRGGL